MTKPRAAAIVLSLLLTMPAVPMLQARPVDLVPVTTSTDYTDTLPRTTIRLVGVTVTPDIAYSTPRGYRPLLLDLYRPDGKSARPLVIFLHGGSWTVGSKRSAAHFTDFPGVLASLARRGFVVASVDYRLSGEARFPAALNDVKSSIRFLRANAKRYGIDPDRVAVWGASAGAHLAALAAFTGDDLDFAQPGMENSEQSDRAQAFVGWYGPYELGSIFKESLGTPGGASSNSGPLAFFGCTAEGCPPGVIEQASPISHVDVGDPPTLLLHGSADNTVPASQSIELDQRLKASDVSSRLIIIDGVSHDWSGKDLQATTAASRKALTETFDWLEKQLLKK
jgi:acetyl esterase/lipase